MFSVRVPPLIVQLKQQQFTLIVIILNTSFGYNNNCSLEFYSRDLRTKNYSLFTQRVFTQDWPNSFWTKCRFHTRLNSNWNAHVALTHDWLNSNWITEFCSVLPFISDDQQQSCECTCRRMCLPSRNLYKCK